MSNTVEKFLVFRLSEGAVLSKNDPAEFKGLIAGSKDYLKVKVLIPDTFCDYSMAMVYSAGGTDYPRPVVNGESAVPNEVTSYPHFSVRVVLQNGGQRIYTNTIEVYQSGKYDA